MRISTSNAVYAFAAVAAMAATPWAAFAQTSANAVTPSANTPNAVVAEPTGVGDIVVTAQKRSQSINNVGMAITAATGEQLKEQGIVNVAGLVKIDPSFVVSTSNYGPPIYSIRGVSYNDFSLAASPTVSIYSDEVPYAYPSMTKGAAFDLERVEILKGPQGTLYGQNATGGAINYIAAKPTKSFDAGLEGTYGSYGASNVNGFVSGPITSTLNGRLSFDVNEGGAWQYSTTRDAHLGDKDQKRVRLLLDWTPTDRLKVSFNLNGWTDKSDNQAGQAIDFNPSVKAFIPTLPQLAAAISTNALTPARPRAADWWSGAKPHNDEQYGQGAVRAEYKLTPDILLTYLGSYESYVQHDLSEPGGVNYEFSLLQGGMVHSNDQELRLSGALLEKRLTWVLGASYEENLANENQYQDLVGSTASYGFSSYLTALHQPVTPYLGSRNVSHDDSKSTGIFADGEYHLLSNLDIHGGVRYTKTNIDHTGCSQDIGGFGVSGINAEEQVLITKANAAGAHYTFVPAIANGCTTLGPTLNPGSVSASLDQSNVSWRIGVDYHPLPNVLTYISVSKGFKAGSFPTLSATSYSQLSPVTQESLLATEIGMKANFFHRMLEVDGDIFYYDYKNKQLEGRVADPVFTALNVLVNVPRSMEDGAELAIHARPIEGLLATVQGTYLNSAVLGSTPGYDAFGVVTNFRGASFPDTPRFAALADVQYSWKLSNALSAFVGASDRYRSKAQSQLATYLSPFAPFPSTVIKGYSLVGLRAGVVSADGHWRVELTGDNIFDKYYITHVEKISDTAARFTGMPATYAITVAYRY